ncbi:uncharacterized protein [Mytilus edulis]|uniref:uncharacterized protein n=1 Tax=Mytilus edulis TaxID=6550 RepID=UPI0039EF3371
MPSGTQDHKGISFLFPVWDLSLNTGLVNLDLSATRSSSKPVDLHVYRQGRLDVSAPSQTFSDSFIHSFDNIAVGISGHMTVIRVESSNSDELSLQMLLHQDNSGIKKSISTLLYPTDVWGLEYYAASYCISSCASYCLITAASFNTKVGVLLRNYNVTVKVHSSSNVIKIEDKLSFDILIDRYQYVVLKSTDDLTGTYIRGDNPISVICGSDFQKFTVAEQLLPVKYFSKDSFSNVFQLYDDSSLNMEYFIRVLTSQSDTICSISTTGSNTYTSTEHLQRKGDYIQFPILESSDLHSINCNKPVQVWNIVIDNEVVGTMTIVPTSLQYYYSNTWHTPDATNGVVQKLYAYKTSTNFPLKYKDQSWSGTKGFVTKLLEATTYTTTTDHHNITFFLWSIGHQDGYAFGTHLAMKLFEQSTCHLGQTADEDCDGHTEEELCTLLGYHFVPKKYIFEVGKYLPDFDLDGNYDEDCAYIVPDCRKPMIPNTTISDYTTASTTYVTSTFSNFTCEEGFTHANTSVTKIECYADGKWMPERICITDCPDPSTVYNNSEIVNGTSFAVRSSVMMNCVDNFTLIGHDVLECTENGTWTIDVFYCSPDCVDPVTVYDNSVIEHGTSWAVGNNITMACMDGFTLLGDNILKCTNDSIWSKDVFSCAADCTDPTPAVQYSEVINPSGLSTFPVDDEYSLTCKTGYSVNGKSVMTCYTNSTWSQPQFSCVPGCGDPRKDIPHSVILNYTEGKPFDAGIDLVMACKTSTTQVGEETVVCLTDKTWNKTLKCIPDCSDPRLEVEVENATLTGFKTGSTTAYKSQYKFRCNLKYRMIGNSYIVCLENSTWSQPQFYCEPCKCPCRRVGVPRYTEVTPEVVNQIQVETSLDLAVNEKILSAYIRLKTSVPNKKQVAKSIGYVGAAFLVVILGSIVLLDIPTLWKHLKHLINRITNFYRYIRH